MADESIFDSAINELIDKLFEFVDHNSFGKIVNKLTDYAEVLTDGKLSGIVNYDYSLDSEQTNLVVDLLLRVQGLAKVFNIAAKGARDVEEEYISNIISDPINPSTISSYVSLRNIIENRLNHQTQQYNVNMIKSNTTTAMPINELRGHVRTYNDLSSSNVTVSTKAYHGLIAASLHDSYVTLMNRTDWWNDRTYMKFFFNEDDAAKRNTLLITKEERSSLALIKDRVEQIGQQLLGLKMNKTGKKDDYSSGEEHDTGGTARVQDSASKQYTDKLLMTPFGRQYGSKIDTILGNIFDPAKKDRFSGIDEKTMQEQAYPLFSTFQNLPNTLENPEYKSVIMDIVDYLLQQDYGVKTFAEKFLYTDRRISFNKFFTGQTKDIIEIFTTQLFVIYIEENFRSLFRIIKSLEMKKFACAFSMRRIYTIHGEDLTTFGFFLIRTIAKIGKIKV
ncbi:MAG: hypothetical protein GY754_23895 [bacterium]|nr:hypothetical protein [bacterium]